MDDYVNFDDDYEYLDDMHDRVRKSYKRNIINTNPIDLYSDYEFFRRFRFTKKIFLNVLLPMVFTELELQPQTDMRGLPISNVWKLLIALRFFATGCYQVIYKIRFKL